jgi:putative copper export protein
MLYIAALTVHVLSVVVWIGGVAFVTMIIFPMIQRTQNSLEQVIMFQGVEHRFSKIAKAMVIISGLSGLYLIVEKGLSPGVWVMIIVWSFYAALLFFLEKALFGKLFSTPPGKKLETQQIFFRLQVFHWVVLGLSFFAVAAGIWTAHY